MPIDDRGPDQIAWVHDPGEGSGIKGGILVKDPGSWGSITEPMERDLDEREYPGEGSRMHG